MLCPKCNQTELILDRVIKDGDNEKFVYVCLNPQCPDYRKAFSPSGEHADTTIQEKK